MKRKTFIANANGFTLIEIIVTLVLVGILFAAGSSFIIGVINNYLFVSANTATLRKGQVAITRMVKELNNINTVDIGNTNQTGITFTSYRSVGTHTLSWGGTGTSLLLDGDVLTDKVSSFSLAYYDSFNGTAQTTWTATRRVIEITLTITGAQGVSSTFTARASPAQSMGL